MQTLSRMIKLVTLSLCVDFISVSEHIYKVTYLFRLCKHCGMVGYDGKITVWFHYTYSLDVSFHPLSI